jgi:pimeloyl-ACP methyl ester carboxylesterase
VTEVSASPATGADHLRRVISTDGTEIVLERVTDGDHDLLLVPGGPSRRARWAAVATGLAGRWSCWLVDRRGKGDSGDTAPYALEREYEDLAAAVTSFRGPVALAGHSSGAICVLGAAGLVTPAALVLYEPPWPVGRPRVPADRIDAVDDLVTRGDRDAAVALAFREMVGVPEPVLAGLRRSPAWSEWTDLIHTWPREMREVEALPGDLGVLAGITAPALVLFGGASPEHLRVSSCAVAAALPTATVVALEGQGHSAPATAPDVVAAAIRDGLGDRS